MELFGGAISWVCLHSQGVGICFLYRNLMHREEQPKGRMLYLWMCETLSQNMCFLLARGTTHMLGYLRFLLEHRPVRGLVMNVSQTGRTNYTKGASGKERLLWCCNGSEHPFPFSGGRSYGVSRWVACGRAPWLAPCRNLLIMPVFPLLRKLSLMAKSTPVILLWGRWL